MWSAGFKWMFLIIGTAIGAGYASGREIWQFFGYESGLAIFLFSIFFTISIAVIMTLSRRLATVDYLPLLDRIVGKRIAPLYDLMIFFYLFTVTVVMIAGSGATGQAFHLSYWWGVVLMAIALVVLFIKGINGILATNSLLLPLLLSGLVYVLIVFLAKQDAAVVADWQNQGNWAASFPFTALNVLPLLAVLGAVGKEIETKGEILIASIGSGAILGIVSFIYNTALIEIADEMLLYEIPLFAILQDFPPSMFMMMSALLAFAIFTTAASSILGIVSRAQRYVGMPMWMLAAVVVLCSVPLTTFGFAALVKYTYPAYGILNLYVLTRLLLYPLWRKKDDSE